VSGWTNWGHPPETSTVYLIPPSIVAFNSSQEALFVTDALSGGTLWENTSPDGNSPGPSWTSWGSGPSGHTIELGPLAMSPSQNVLEVLVPTTNGDLAIAGAAFPNANTWSALAHPAAGPWTGAVPSGVGAGDGRFWYGGPVNDGNTLYDAIFDWHAETPGNRGATASNEVAFSSY